ncbi:MAG: SufE family protein [Gluconobacter sp.]|uniref:SufE family protein n=1 Tax=unclassified Gluconobacter TaxID=2644261 RepID=UPI001B8C2135|nr:SufE family protein [Gluconobacter sp. Dm-73]
MSDAYLVPPEDTAAAAIEEIEAELSLFDDWMERYQYIIEMGRKLPPFPEDWQDDAHRVPGCQSQVWLEAIERDGKLFFAGASDAAIVQGLVALLLRVYSGRSSAEILGTSPVFLHEMGLVKALSTNRGNGVEAMAQAIQKRAALQA